jgi:glycosyltransferase involved in cell wall biosynthesis
LKTPVTIIIPTYNRAAFVLRAVESVWAQSWPVQELIVIDDGSTDETKQLLTRYNNRPNFIYHYQDNRGRAIARNEGMKMASGEWLMYLDSDDYLDPLAIETLFQHASADSPAGIIFGNYVLVENGIRTEVHHGTIPRNKTGVSLLIDLLRNRYCLTKTGSFLMKTSLARQVQGFSTAFEPSEDLDYAIKCLMNSKATSLTDVVLYVERHEGNSDEFKMQDSMIRTCKFYLASVAEWGPSLDTSTRLEAITALKWRIANAAYEIDRHREAFQFYMKLIWAKPGSILDTFIFKQIFASTLPPTLKKMVRKKSGTK